jgi:NADH-quinone oxidoreductase subunit C
MTPGELAAVWSGRFGDAVATAETFGTLTVDVNPARWVEALEFARDGLGCAFFDWLTAVDELADGFGVVAHVYSPESGHHLLIRTRVPRAEPVLPTATGVYRGADWHERETYEMFGVVFTGHPNPVPLLLPDGFEGYPLRKEFVLAARVAKAWPGAKEPGESGAPARRRLRPPGVPADWGQNRENRQSPTEPMESGEPGKATKPRDVKDGGDA